jgi:hypothetical protein
MKPRKLLGCILQIGAFFGHDRALNGAHLQTNSAINARRKINPIPIRPFGVFARTGMNARDRTSINAISDAFTNVSNNRMGHGTLSLSVLSLEGRAWKSTEFRSTSKIHYDWTFAQINQCPSIGGGFP